MNVQKVTITRVYASDTDKNGNKLVSKTGKPYSKLAIKTTQHGEKWLSGFKGKENENWKEGDQVDVIVTQNGEYLNYEVPKQTDRLEARVAALEVQVMNLNNKLAKVASPATMAEPSVADLNNVLPPDTQPDF